MEQVRSLGAVGLRLARRTSFSAWAWEGSLLGDEEMGGGGVQTDLGLGIVFGLGLGWDDGPALIGVDQIAGVVADDTG